MQVRKQQVELDMEQQTGSKRERICQGFILSPCLFNLYAEYIMRNAGLDEAQAGIKMARRNNNMQMIWLRGESVCLQGGRPGFNPWVGKIPWRRKWQPTPVFLPEESQGRRSLVGYSPWGHKESDTTERLYFHFHHPYGRK